MALTMKDVIRREAISVWNSIRVEERLKLTLEEFTFKVNNREPKRNYSPVEMRPIFKELRAAIPIRTLVDG
jgi:hypothetical protein